MELYGSVSNDMVTVSRRISRNFSDARITHSKPDFHQHFDAFYNGIGVESESHCHELGLWGHLSVGDLRREATKSDVSATNRSGFSQEFVKWNDVTLGNCFTFNHENSSTHYYSRMPGSRGGEAFLNLEVLGFKALMYLNQSEYLPWEDTAAILVFVTNVTDAIYSESAHYFAAPDQIAEFQIQNVGVHCNFQLTKIHYSRLGGVYGTCITSIDQVKSFYGGSTYSTDVQSRKKKSYLRVATIPATKMLSTRPVVAWIPATPIPNRPLSVVSRSGLACRRLLQTSVTHPRGPPVSALNPVPTETSPSPGPRAPSLPRFVYVRTLFFSQHPAKSPRIFQAAFPTTPTTTSSSRFTFLV